MRHLPRSTRIAVATIYLRYRDARRKTARSRVDDGIGSSRAIAAQAAELEIWNALVAMHQNMAGDTGAARTPAKEFLRMIAIRGRMHVGALGAAA